MEKKNIIYFVADQMRSDSLHHLGNQASITPHLDALAKEGVSFNHAFCQNPVCVPSRCSFLTGLYPHTTGHRTMHYLQDENEPNILREMKNNGYEVIWCGRNDVIPAERDKSEYCDEYYSGLDEQIFKAYATPPTGKPTDEGFYSFYTGDTTSSNLKTMDDKEVEYALDYLERRKKEKNDKPFFLYISLGLPHPPYGCAKPFYGTTDRHMLPPRRKDLSKTKGKPSMLKGIHDKQNLSHWSEEQWNELRGTYLDMVSKFDNLFGKVKEKLIQTNLDDDTSIFVFSDHGDYTGDYGIAEKVQNCFDDPVCNVPLIIRPAKNIACKPRISNALVELIDLSATVADIAGIKLSYTQFGKSLLNVLAGEENHREVVLCEGGRIHGETQCMENGHGVTSLYWPRLSTQSSEGSEHTKAIMLRDHDYKYVKRLYEDDEFYDLKKDPMEMYNCIHESGYQSMIQKFKEKLLDKLISTADFVPNRKDRRF